MMSHPIPGMEYHLYSGSDEEREWDEEDEKFDPRPEPEEETEETGVLVG